MKTVTCSVLTMIAIVLLTGCQNTSFQKTKSNLVYKIYKSKDTAAVREGDVIKVQVIQKINDSTYFDSHQSMPVYLPAGQPRPYDASEVFTKLKLNDSLVTVQMMDTFIKQNPRNAGQFKNGDRIITTFRVLRIYKKGEDYRADQQKDMEAQQVREEAEAKTDLIKQTKEMEDYFVAKKLTPQKTTLGAYIVVKEPGTGESIDSGKFVTLKYSGKHFANDSVFQASEMTTQIQGPRPSIKGFEDGLKALKNGGKGTIYIPGALAYGKHPAPGSPFKPNEALIFDVEIVKVSDTNADQQPRITMPQAKPDTTKRKK